MDDYDDNDDDEINDGTQLSDDLPENEITHSDDEGRLQSQDENVNLFSILRDLTLICYLRLRFRRD